MNTFEDKKTTDILIVDDEDDIREVLELSFLRMGLSCHLAASIAHAHTLLEKNHYRLCLTDMRLNDGDGIDLVAHIQAQQPQLPVAVMTGYGSIETAIRALKCGAFDFLTKPLEIKVLRELVYHALKLNETPQQDHDKLTKLIGQSPALNQLRDQITKLSRNQAPVFIHGESGTGKEVVARSIHLLSARADDPFIPVNCGALTPELMESEFFGYKKGSFTGATSDKIGLFQAANGGTLFLDEVADLSLPMQVKLLRAIQERAVRPIGSQKEESVDVRILSASHKNLTQMVAEGSFRQDLFFRINVISLQIPPLRQRREDIEILSKYILTKLAKREGSAPKELAEETLEALQQYTFPGNVRELENILERACAMADGTLLTEDDLNLPTTAADIISTQVILQAPPLDDSIDENEERLQILQALEAHRWNRSAAARQLGLTLRQLRYRLKKWNLG